jgi:hypothetical protein
MTKASNQKTAKAKRPVAQKQIAPRATRKAVHQIDWQGIAISVSYEPDWHGLSKEYSQFSTAHLEIESVSPAKQELPITETGYRSHFIAREMVEQVGGPVAYVRRWLDEAAKAPSWKQREVATRQLQLF